MSVARLYERIERLYERSEKSRDTHSNQPLTCEAAIAQG